MGLAEADAGRFPTLGAASWEPEVDEEDAYMTGEHVNTIKKHNGFWCSSVGHRSNIGSNISVTSIIHSPPPPCLSLALKNLFHDYSEVFTLVLRHLSLALNLH